MDDACDNALCLTFITNTKVKKHFYLQNGEGEVTEHPPLEMGTLFSNSDIVIIC